jgi:hypothetical protein
MVHFDLAIEENNHGWILDFLWTLILVVVGDKSKSSLFVGGFLHTQHIVKFGLPFVTLY